MLYLMTITEQYLIIYVALIHKLEQFIETPDILSAGKHLAKPLFPPAELTIC